MRKEAPAAAGRSWQATLIVVIVALAVAGAAGAGWWYARESPPHQGPIVLISIDGLQPGRLAAYGATTTEAPAIDALAADAVVFERAYTHSPLLLPAHASLLAGQLPFEHGIRDDAGFVLRDEARPLAELLRNRGFDTGAAVSSFLLRRESGMAQGFQFFDADLPAPSPGAAPVVERDGELTIGAAERWLSTQGDQRFFLFVQVDDAAADTATARVVQQLKDRGLYDDATILLTADRGETDTGVVLDDRALRVPLIVKQPDNEGAGRRVGAPVQHVDVLPTVLDLVRAPIPSGLAGRSLRAVLDEDDGTVIDQPIYSESLAARFRLGDQPSFAVTTRGLRLIHDGGDQLVELAPAPEDPPPGPADADAMRRRLERFARAREISLPGEIPAADEDRYAALGYLGGATVGGTLAEAALHSWPVAEREALVRAQRAAARLAAEKRYAPAVDRLRAIVRTHPTIAIVHYQIGTLLMRSGRLEEAVASFRTASSLQPDNPFVTVALAQALTRINRLDEAYAQATLAVALAERHGERAQAAAHEGAARIALTRTDAEAASRHAAAADALDPAIALRQFVRGTLLYNEGKFEEALAPLSEAETILRDNSRVLEGLQLALGNTLAQLERPQDAEVHVRDEIAAFPRNLRAYSALATLYRASNRVTEIDTVVTELLGVMPTPEGYATAARLWMIMGERARADAVSADARSRFRGDPSLALFVRGR